MQTKWTLCPICGNKTRLQPLPDTELKNFPRYCPKLVEGNTRAKNLYERFGFRETGKNFRALKYDDGSYRDEYKMVKILAG